AAPRRAARRDPGGPVRRSARRRGASLRAERGLLRGDGPVTPIYLDNNATTRTDPRVLEAMLPFFTERYGNAASRHHAFGRDAEEATEQSREQVADLIGAKPREIVFASGAAESDNLALKGVMAANRPRGDHLITAVTEHHAVL